MVAFILIVILTFFIVFSSIWSRAIIKWRTKKIIEKRKEILKIRINDISLYVQVSLGLGIAFLLYSLSLEGIKKIGWGLFGLILEAIGTFLLFWVYSPFQNKLREQYK